MLEKIQITDTSVINVIRTEIPIATIEDKGLATPGMAYSVIRGSITLSAGEEVNFENRYSLVLLSNSASGSSILFLHANNSVKIVETGSMFSFLSNVQDKLSVISDGEYAFFVKNNTIKGLNLTYCIMRSQ